MNVKQRLRAFLRTNPGLKAVALFLSIVIWLHAKTERETEKELKFNLIYLNLKKNYVVKGPGYIGVRVRGRGKDILRLLLAPNLRRIYCDLKGVKRGRKYIKISKENIKLPDWVNVEIVDINPKSFFLDIDQIASRKYRIIPRFTARPKYRYEVIPDTITLKGTLSKLNATVILRTEKIKPGKPGDTVEAEIKIPEGLSSRINKVKIIFKK